MPMLSGQLENRIYINTYETRHRIPESSGCYAWFLPLYQFEPELSSNLELVSKIFNYEPSRSSPTATAKLQLDWETFEINATRSMKCDTPAQRDVGWRKAVKSHGRAVDSFLIDAACTSCPRCTSVRRISSVHATTSTSQIQRIGSLSKNSFASRFNGQASRLGLGVWVPDLIFACIESPDGAEVLTREADLAELLEFVLIRLGRPPYSVR